MKRLDSPDEPENDGSGDWIPRTSRRMTGKMAL
jgi:hypothetical protein